jgi:photosystem II stability/assembly factor-like uncharacterized protein
MTIGRSKSILLAAVVLGAVLYYQLVPTVERVPPVEHEPSFGDNFYDVAIQDELVWIVGYYGTILRSRDRGLSWELQASDTREALFRVSFIDSNEGWISGSYGTILHSRDSGKTWQVQATPLEEHLFGLHFIDARRGWAVGSRGTVLVTEDGGSTWIDRSIGEDVILNDVRFIDAKEGWVVGEFGRIYRTVDGGHNWTRQNSPIEVPLVSGESRNLFRLLLTDDGMGWAFGLDGVILANENGQSWTLSNADSAANGDASRYHLFSASAVNGHKWAVGERGTVWVAAATGEWHPADLKAPPVSLNGIAFGRDGLGLIVGNRGMILRSSDAGKHWHHIGTAPRHSGKGVSPDDDASGRMDR